MPSEIMRNARSLNELMPNEIRLKDFMRNALMRNGAKPLARPSLAITVITQNHLPYI